MEHHAMIESATNLGLEEPEGSARMKTKKCDILKLIDLHKALSMDCSLEINRMEAVQNSYIYRNKFDTDDAGDYSVYTTVERKEDGDRISNPDQLLHDLNLIEQKIEKLKGAILDAEADLLETSSENAYEAAVKIAYLSDVMLFQAELEPDLFAAAISEACSVLIERYRPLQVGPTSNSSC